MHSIDQLKSYVTERYAEVEGWCWEYNWQPLQYLSACQESMGEDGPIAEIGVYHGKFFIGLALLKAGRGSHLALDVFDLQQFSLSGNGSRIVVPAAVSSQLRETFESNIERQGVRTSDVTIIRGDSTNFLAREIPPLVPNFKKFSIFSVDGCHEFTHAYHDIGVAMELTDHAGIILVDDYMHSHWPGVHEAVAKWMFGSAPRFVPLYYIHNKLALCHVNFHHLYLEGLAAHYREHHKSAKLRRITRFGWPTLTLEPDTGAPVFSA